MNTATPRKKKRWLVLAAVAAVIAVSIGACAVYVNDYYRADTTAVSALTSRATVTVETLDDGSIAFRPDEPVAGFIFYPGGKVDHTAYAPLMQACAERGILCVLVKMPLRLAVLDINAADGIAAQYPAITDWYIGGHSLGGSMAATYLDKHRDDFAGLILLGSYSTADLSDSSLSVLSVYGSEDRVLNAENYAENRANLPDDITEIVINGGCHAYFGAYGAQDGDGTPTISNDEQIRLTADAVASMATS